MLRSFSNHKYFKSQRKLSKEDRRQKQKKKKTTTKWQNGYRYIINKYFKYKWIKCFNLKTYSGWMDIKTHIYAAYKTLSSDLKKKQATKLRG